MRSYHFSLLARKTPWLPTCIPKLQERPYLRLSTVRRHIPGWQVDRHPSNWNGWNCWRSFLRFKRSSQSLPDLFRNPWRPKELWRTVDLKI